MEKRFTIVNVLSMLHGKQQVGEGWVFLPTPLFPYSPYPCLPSVSSQATIPISSPVNNNMTLAQEGNHIQTFLALIVNQNRTDCCK